jgi:tRNA-specific 2-thiouridylase
MNEENAQKTVFVGLSGGVDSAVSAYLLVQAGYMVVGVFMKNFSQEMMVNGQLTECWVPEWHDALRVAAHLKIPLQRWDFEKEYRAEVYEYFKNEYAAGRTPNPDVLCNSHIKFGVFFRRARAEGADFIATGHYAQAEGGHLLRSADDDKDQTYFLNQISREAVEHTLFPIGHLPKSQVREIAREAGLPVADKKDSTGICFVGELPIKELLADFIKPKPGRVVTTAGEVVGEHDGLSWYTIGQRHGFGVTGGGAPLFVVKKNFETNELIVGGESDPALFSTEISVVGVRWINPPEPGAQLIARFRHRQPLQEVVSWSVSGDHMILKMKEPQRAITPGQFAVLYREDECLGGGVIID